MNNTTLGTNIGQLKELDKKYYLHPTSSVKQQQQNGPVVIFKEGNGIYLTDIEGNQYIDGLSSLWNVNIGHGRKELADVAQEQMSKLAFSSSFQNYSHDKAIELASKLASMTPGDLNVSFFTSGGSESNDTAFKIVRHYWKIKGQEKRTKIIALNRAYHGITIGATSATGLPTFQNFSTSNAPNFLHARPHKTNSERGDQSDLDYGNSIRGIIEREGAETIAAVILEPIQGAGGVHIPPAGYLQAIRDLCDEYGILLITDEIICGFGRTGKMFGVENWNIVPDIMTVAKGITSGYIQLGAVIMREFIRDEIAELSDQVLFHGFTYSGHPTACAVALKNIEIIENEGIVENAKIMETEFLKGIRYLKEKHPYVTNERFLGLLGGGRFNVRSGCRNSFCP